MRSSGKEIKHLVAYHPFLLNPAEIEYWSMRIKNDVQSKGTYGTVRTNEGDFQVDESYRRCKVLFVDPFSYEANHEEILMNQRLMYLLLGMVMVSSRTILSAYNYNVYYNNGDIIQLAMYNEGDMYDVHHDGGFNGKGNDLTDRRKISIGVCVANAQEGGQFIVPGASLSDEQKKIINTPGTAYAFPSITKHGVEPVIRGTRLSITLWVHGT